MIKAKRKRKSVREESLSPAVGSVSTLALEGYVPRGNLSGGAHLDFGVLFVVFTLILIGCLMVYSASISLADSPKYKVGESFFLYRHLISLGLALFVAVIAWCIPMKVWNSAAPVLFVLGIILLIAVLIPGVGRSTNGASRWIPLGPINLQATEFMKVAVLLYAANFTVRKQNYMHSFKKGFIPMGLVIALVGVLVLKEPDLGAFVMIVCIAMGILFLGGSNLKVFFSMAGVLVSVLVLMIFAASWRAARFFAYLDPWEEKNALGKAYQLSHSLIAFGRGEALGVGLGDAIEKQHYLPEAHTDFILAILGEELGFVGVTVVLLLFLWLVRKAFIIGRRAVALDHFFPGLVAQGIGIWFGVQTFINVGVASGLLPTKGLTLPFVSYGGSALMATMVAVALLLRIDWENKQVTGGSSS